MSWILILLSGLLEVVWVLGSKYSDGFTRLWPSVLTLIAMLGSVVFFSLATREISLGTGYAVWVGIGVLGTALLEAFVFQGVLKPIQIGCLIGLTLSLIGLKVAS